MNYTSPVAMNYEELEGLVVRLDQLVYLPELDAPADRAHPFAYFITIDNQSSESLVIERRKWLVKDEKTGVVEVIEGEGVVGSQPRIEAGEQFSYNSYHICGAVASVSGAYFGRSSSGRSVVVKTPQFRLVPPEFM